MFYFDSIGGKKVLKSDSIKGILHFFTTKESFIKTKEADNISAANKNKEEICRYLKIKPEHLISPHQTHGSNVEIVSKDKKEYPDCDALILDNPKYAIFLSFADCTPVIIYDNKNNVAAVIHGGWRSTALSICKKTLIRMEKTYGTCPSEVTAAIFPHICFKCFETSLEAIDALKATVNDKNGLFSGRYADLGEINARQLIESGVKSVDISPYCTCCNNDLFFSYRHENKTTNRNSLIAKLIR